jgi:flavin-dependent dehydrogenase
VINDAAVLVVGGGPAGLATASALARKGLRVSVVERSDYRGIRIGEHIAPAALRDLRAMGFPSPDDGGGGAHLGSSGVDAWWGGSTASHMDYVFHPAGRGFNLSRPLFDASLAGKCREDGVAILSPARLVRADWKRSRWVAGVHVREQAGVLQPRFIVDATGRAAAFARARGSHVHAEDRQIALVAVGGSRMDDDESGGRVLIESAETGWWYFAPLSGGRCVCMFVTDADLLPSRARARLPLWWQQQVQSTGHVRGRVAQYGRLADPIVRCARSQRLDRFAGAGWCAVGDAAMAFDPLSSQGIGKAVEHGHRAADAIDAHLSGDRDALRDYCHVLEEEHEDYRRTRVSYYDIERRWPGSEFWQRRQTATGNGVGVLLEQEVRRTGGLGSTPLNNNNS